MRADARVAGLLAGSRTMLVIPLRTAGSRTMLAGECPLFSAWRRFEDGAPATHIRLPSRFSFASSSAYRKGFPKYRRAFSAYINSLYMRHADDARGTVLHSRLADSACGTVLYGRLADDACGGVPPLRRRGALRTEPPPRMSAKPLRFSAVEVQRCYRPS